MRANRSIWFHSARRKKIKKKKKNRDAVSHHLHSCVCFALFKTKAEWEFSSVRNLEMNTCSHSLPFCCNWFSRMALFNGGGRAMHAEMYMLVWFVICASQCCLFSCVICPVHALFLVHLSFISRGKLGVTRLTSQQSSRWCRSRGGSRVESSCSIELSRDPKRSLQDSAVRC